MTKLFNKVILMIAMFFLLVVSCGNKETAAAATETPTLKLITIGGGKPDNYDSWIKKVNEYIEPKIGAKIEVEVISWGDWDSRRSVISTSNEPFDILFSNLNVYYNDVNTGLFLDLTDLLNKPEFKALHDTIPDKFWNGAKINGKIYSVPTYKDSSSTLYFIFDKNLVDASKFDITKVKTLGDIEDYLTYVTKTTKKPSYILTNQGADQIFNNYDRFGLPMNVLGVKIDDTNLQVVNLLQQPEIVKDLETLHKWYQAGIINPDAATTTENPKYRPLFIEQGWPLAAKTVWGPQNGVEVVLSQYGPTILSNGTVQGSLNGISASSAYPEKALEFLQLINTDSKLRDMFAYGEEGVTFDYVTAFGEQRVDRDPATHKEWPLPAYSQAQFFNLTITKDVEENQWDEVKKLNDQAVPSVLLGFTFDTTNVQDEIANVDAIYRKYKAELLTGTKEPKELIAKMLEEMNSVGLEKIREEAQKQIDQFKATK